MSRWAFMRQGRGLELAPKNEAAGRGQMSGARQSGGLEWPVGGVRRFSNHRVTIMKGVNEATGTGCTK